MVTGPKGLKHPSRAPFHIKKKKSSGTYIDFHDKIINTLKMTMRGFCVSGRSRRKRRQRRS